MVGVAAKSKDIAPGSQGEGEKGGVAVGVAVTALHWWAEKEAVHSAGHQCWRHSEPDNDEGEYIIHTLYGECPAVAPSVSAAKSKDIAHSKFVES